MQRVCTVRLLDEVNCSLVGLDEITLKKAADAVTYSVKNSRFMKQVKAKWWNGKISLVNRRNGLTYRHMLDRVLPPIVGAGYDIAVDDRRFQHDISVPQIGDDLFEGYSYKRFTGIMASHQVEAINTVTANHGGLLLMATGAGKTVITAALAHLYQPFGKVMIIVPQQDLVVQTQETIQALGMPECGAFYGDDHNPQHITVSTWQSLQNRPELFQDVIMVLVDEVHRADAKVLFKLLTEAGCKVPIRIGLTGTLPTDDLSKNNIIAALGPVVYVKKAKALQDEGFLARCKIFILKYLDRHRTEYKAVMRDHELYIDESRWHFRHPDRLDHLSALIDTVSQDGNTLVLVRNIEYGDALHARIPGSIYLNGKDKSKLRQQVYRATNDATNRVLIATYSIASVGIDIARLFNLVLIEPGKQAIGIVQSIGRGLRLADDKQSVMVYHVGSDAKFSNKHLSEVKQIYDDNEYPYEMIEVDY